MRVNVELIGPHDFYASEADFEEGKNITHTTSNSLRRMQIKSKDSCRSTGVPVTVTAAAAAARGSQTIGVGLNEILFKLIKLNKEKGEGRNIPETRGKSAN